MRRTRKDNPLKDHLLRALGEFIDISDRAKSVEVTLKFDRECIPIISYKVDALPLILEEVEQTKKPDFTNHTGDDYEQ